MATDPGYRGDLSLWEKVNSYELGLNLLVAKVMSSVAWLAWDTGIKEQQILACTCLRCALLFETYAAKKH